MRTLRAFNVFSAHTEQRSVVAVSRFGNLKTYPDVYRDCTLSCYWTQAIGQLACSYWTLVRWLSFGPWSSVCRSTLVRLFVNARPSGPMACYLSKSYTQLSNSKFGDKVNAQDVTAMYTKGPFQHDRHKKDSNLPN